MSRLPILLFVISLIGLCWLGMQASHEAGHALAALATGGRIEKIVLHPLAISRTDVSPNPRPWLVVWAGPAVGVLFPLLLWSATPRKHSLARGSSQFFAGFCLIANGAYIGLGSVWGIGDCGEMLRTGTPMWLMWAFGTATVPIGFYLWHRLGSPGMLLDADTAVSWPAAIGMTVVLVACIAASLWLSHRF